MIIRKSVQTDKVIIYDCMLQQETCYVVEKDGQVVGYFDLRNCEELEGDQLDGKIFEKANIDIEKDAYLYYINSSEKGCGKEMLKYIFNELKINKILLEAYEDKLPYWIRKGAVVLDGCNCTFREDIYRLILTKELFENLE